MFSQVTGGPAWRMVVGLGGQNAGQGLLVGRLDFLIQLRLLQLAQVAGNLLVSAGDGLPVHVDGGLVLLDQILIEGLNAEVDYVQFLFKQLVNLAHFQTS